MTPDQRNEQLNVAIDALLRGASRDEAEAGLPDELRPLLDTAGSLAAAGRGSRGGARPSFVLGLEDQLRTDLRLQRRVGPRAAPRERLWRLLIALVSASLLMLVAVERSGPSDPLYGVKQRIEEGRLLLTGAGTARVDSLLDSAWLGLAQVRRLHELPDSDVSADEWQSVLDGLTDAYAAAAAAALESGDVMQQRRVRSAADLAADELSRLADQAARNRLATARWFRLSAARLRQSIASLPPEGGDPRRVVGPSVAPTATLPAAAATAAVGPSAAPAEPTTAPVATDAAAPAATSSPTSGSTPPALAPPPATTTATVAAVGPSPTASSPPPGGGAPEPSQVPATVAVRPPFTPPPVTPTNTPQPSDSTPGSSVVTTATVTPDSWVVTSTPDPADVTPTVRAQPETPPPATIEDPGSGAPTSPPTMSPTGQPTAPPTPTDQSGRSAPRPSSEPTRVAPQWTFSAAPGAMDGPRET
ncbi:MAG: hypothetical protein ACK2T6_08450 [Anaerolineae bacterium]